MATMTVQAEANAGEEFVQLLYRGGELLAAGNVAEARDHLERAVGLQPANEKGKNLLGLTYFKLGLFDRAAQLYEGLVQENPADPTLRVNLGLVYLKTNALSRAIHEFATATDLAPDHKKAHNYLGLALAQTGQYEKAQEHFLLAGSDAMAEKMAQAVAGDAEGPASGDAPSHTVAGPVAPNSFDLEATEAGSEAQFESSAGRPAEASEEMFLAGDVDYSQLPDQGAGWTAQESLDGGTAGPDMPGEGEDRFMEDDGPTQPQYERSLSGRAPVTLFPPPSAPSTELAAPAMGDWTPGVESQPGIEQPFPPESFKLADLAPTLRIFGGARVEPFEIRPDVVLISISGELLTRLSGLVAYSGVLDFKPERKRFRGRLTDRSFGEGQDQVTRAKGNGILVLDPKKRAFVATDVGGESAYFREDVVFAFEEPLAFENGRLPSDVTPDLDLVYLRGKGQVLLCPGGPLRSLEVTSLQPVTVPLENLVGWCGSLTPRIAILAFDENGKVIRAGVELSGDGFLLFSSPLG